MRFGHHGWRLIAPGRHRARFIAEVEATGDKDKANARTLMEAMGALRQQTLWCRGRLCP